MKLLIFGANWYNHGDESAIRSMLDEIISIYPKAEIRIVFNQDNVSIPYKNIKVYTSFYAPSRRHDPFNYISYNVAKVSNWHSYLFFGKYKDKINEFNELANWCDYAIYAPGGPSFGDIYRQWFLVDEMIILHNFKKPYFFYAPSMGPFTLNRKHIKYALENADYICLREEKSKIYLEQININKKPLVTLDAAFQHPFDEYTERKILEQNKKLLDFIRNRNTVGITITNLRWHDKDINLERENRIKESFGCIIKYLINNGYNVLLIPQLFGKDNDSNYMKQFLINERCYIIDEKYDCYFQQYLISRIHSVIGMRYHSNIFSAKVGTPFISVSYEQKMSGFMSKAKLSQYCLNIDDLTPENLLQKYKLLESTYLTYKNILASEQHEFIDISKLTTQKLCDQLEKHNIR